MIIFSKKIVAALAVAVVGLGSLTACSGNESSAEGTPTTPSPTMKTESLNPSPTPEAPVASFDVTDKQGYTYGITVQELPDLSYDIDTTQGPPGYVKVLVYNAPVKVRIENKTPGKVAPKMAAVAMPVWEKLGVEPVDNSNATCSPNNIHDGLGDVHCSWDWRRFNLVGANDHWHECGESARDVDCPFVNGGYVGGYSYISYNYEENGWIDVGNAHRDTEKNWKYSTRTLHNWVEGYGGPGNEYVVREDKAKEFADTMTNPSGYVVSLSDDRFGEPRIWLKDEGFSSYRQFIPYNPNVN